VGIGFLSDLNIGADVRYSYGFSNIVKDAGDQKVRNNVIQIGVFYAFGGDKK